MICCFDRLQFILNLPSNVKEQQKSKIPLLIADVKNRWHSIISDSFSTGIFWANVIFVLIHNPSLFINQKHQDGDLVNFSLLLIVLANVPRMNGIFSCPYLAVLIVCLLFSIIEPFSVMLVVDQNVFLLLCFYIVLDK